MYHFVQASVDLEGRGLDIVQVMSNQLHSTSPHPQVKICDFGVAEELDPFSQTDTIKGSQGAPMFIAPEIAVGKDVFSGHKLDVCSVGVSLYNFVTGT